MHQYWKEKIFHLEEDRAIQKQVDGRLLVTTNGCFDVFHIGHLHSLFESSRLGEALIVGLNSDASVRRLKGSDRPVFNQAQRASILAALPFITAVVVFEEDTPVNFLRRFKPAVHTKGADYRSRLNQIPEYEVLKDWDGRIEIIEYISDVSSSETIRRYSR